MKDGWRHGTRGLCVQGPYAGTGSHASLELRQHGNLSNGRSLSQGSMDYIFIFVFNKLPAS